MQEATEVYRAGPSFPLHSPAYLAARAPLWKRWTEQRAPYWAQFMASKIDHPEYCRIVAPFWRQYSRALEPHWIKAGGAPTLVR